MRRAEGEEEAGLLISEEDPTLVHTVHVLDHEDAVPRIQPFFRARRWKGGEPHVLEKDKCIRGSLVAPRRPAGADRPPHNGRRPRHPERQPLQQMVCS
ncbi:NUDIX hydrolase [Streptomyces peucetius]